MPHDDTDEARPGRPADGRPLRSITMRRDRHVVLPAAGLLAMTGWVGDKRRLHVVLQRRRCDATFRPGGVQGDSALKAKRIGGRSGVAGLLRGAASALRRPLSPAEGSTGKTLQAHLKGWVFLQ